MESNYILVSSDLERRKLWLPSAYEMAKYRFSNGFWGINEGTAHQNALKQGDRAVVYLSGSRDYSQHFVGVCRIDSAKQHSSAELRSKLSSSSKHDYAMPPYHISLRDCEMFDNPVSLLDIAEQLQLVKDPKQWWRYLQGGVRRISDRDFNLILQKTLKDQPANGETSA